MIQREDIYYLRSRNVKRVLWPIDHKQVGLDLKSEQQKLTKEFTQKYNFDFETDKPLHGKYRWVSIRSESPENNELCREDIPCCSTTTERLTTTSAKQKMKRVDKKRRASNDSSCSNISHCSDLPPMKKKREKRSPVVLRKGTRKRQARI